MFCYLNSATISFSLLEIISWVLFILKCRKILAIFEFIPEYSAESDQLLQLMHLTCVDLLFNLQNMIERYWLCIFLTSE